MPFMKSSMFFHCSNPNIQTLNFNKNTGDNYPLNLTVIEALGTFSSILLFMHLLPLPKYKSVKGMYCFVPAFVPLVAHNNWYILIK